MKSRVLKISESYVSHSPLVYTCHGLGSCVGVFIIDRITNLAGGAHIALPSLSLGTTDFLNANIMMEGLLNQFRELGSNLTALRAKIIGGAQVLEGSLGLGSQNVKSVQELLITHRILISSQDVGGTAARTARFNSKTGELRVSTSAGKRYSV